MLPGLNMRISFSFNQRGLLLFVRLQLKNMFLVLGILPLWVIVFLSQIGIIKSPWSKYTTLQMKRLTL